MILSHLQAISQVHGEKGRVICNINKMNQAAVTPQRFLLGILDGGVPPGSPNLDPISDEKMSYFFTPVFRPGPGFSKHGEV